MYDHGEALNIKPSCKADLFFRVDVDLPQRIWIHHTASKHLNLLPLGEHAHLHAQLVEHKVRHAGRVTLSHGTASFISSLKCKLLLVYIESVPRATLTPATANWCAAQNPLLSFDLDVGQCNTCI